VWTAHSRRRSWRGDRYGSVAGDAVGSNEQTIWSGPVGALTMAAREGQDAPGTFGVRYLHLGRPRVSASGDVSFRSYLQGATATDENNEGVWRVGPDGQGQLLARSAWPVPGESGLRYAKLMSDANTNTAGVVAFRTGISNWNLGVPSGNGRAAWVETPDRDAVVVVPGSGGG
jgi:hypothetical protein